MGVAVTTVRPMTPADVLAVAALEERYQPRPWSQDVLRDELELDNRTYLVAVADEIIGFGGVMVVGDEAHVTNLLVAESHRRRGLGRRLLRELVESAVAAGARHVTLEVRKSNHVARSLYAEFGLVPVGIRPDYYGDDDALILWAHEIDDPAYLEGLQ